MSITSQKEHRGEVLVAVMNNHDDFTIATDQHWYRIPVDSVDKFLKKRWPPQWLAFYQTKIFGHQAYTVYYYAKINKIQQVTRLKLFPHLPKDAKANKCYYQILLDPLQHLPKPIISRRWRRIVFIPTTWEKFNNAVEINDLYDESPLEDRLWAELKRLQIPAERQEFIQCPAANYFLDFAVYCIKNKIDIETDGDTWHANPKQATKDNIRDNALEMTGWKVLRFSTGQIQEHIADYCVPVITQTINHSGGVTAEGELEPRKIDPEVPGEIQLGLFALRNKSV